MAGMTVLLLLLWAGVTVSSPVNLQKRIFGGKTCDRATRHYHVFVEGSDGTHSSMCGGSLIHKDWVLTAAHCKKSTVTAFLDVHPGDLTENKKKGGVKIKEREIYNNSDGPHDLMLLKLETPIKTKTEPIELPTVNECKELHKITEIEVAGYGPTTLGGNDRPPTLQCGKIGLLSAEDCTDEKNAMKNCRDSYTKILGHSDILCFLSRTVAIQSGDSGGGVVHNGKLYGVIVAGPDDKDACVEASIAMNLCSNDYRKWITKHTGIKL